MVKDRIQAVNLMLDAETLRVNIDRCPMTAEALEMQAYNKHGEPDKEGGFDHPNDALGYGVVYKFGHTRTAVTLSNLTGI